MTTQTPSWVNIALAAARLGVTVRHVKRLVSSGAVESTKRGGSRLIAVESIDDYLNRKRDVCHFQCHHWSREDLVEAVRQVMREMKSE